MWRSLVSSSDEPDTGKDLPDPQEEAALQARYDRVLEEKRMALEHPGLSWHDWFLFDGAKWWVGLVDLIVDSWIVAYWYGLGNFLLLGLSLAAALYGEFLLYRFLWYRPRDDERPAPRSGPGSLRARLVRPVPCGRWTPEAAGYVSVMRSSDGTPNPHEFL